MARQFAIMGSSLGLGMGESFIRKEKDKSRPNQYPRESTIEAEGEQLANAIISRLEANGGSDEICQNERGQSAGGQEASIHVQRSSGAKLKSLKLTLKFFRDGQPVIVKADLRRDYRGDDKDKPDVRDRAEWFLNLTCNPTQIMTGKRGFAVATDSGQSLGAHGLTQFMVCGYHCLFEHLMAMNVKWQPSDRLLDALANGDVNFNTIEFGYQTKSLSSHVIKKSFDFMQEFYTSQQAVKGRTQSIAAVLGLKVDTASRASTNVFKGIVVSKLNIGILSKATGNGTIEAEVEVGKPAQQRLSFCLKLTKHYFITQVPDLKEAYEHGNHPSLSRILHLGVDEKGKFIELSDNEASQDSLFEALAVANEHVLEHRLKIKGLVFSQVAPWRSMFNELLALKMPKGVPHYSGKGARILQAWKEMEGPDDREVLRKAAGSQSTYSRILKKFRVDHGLDLALPFWVYTVRDEVVKRQFRSNSERIRDSAGGINYKISNRAHLALVERHDEFFKQAEREGLSGLIAKSVKGVGAKLSRFDARSGKKLRKDSHKRPINRKMNKKVAN